MILLDTHTMLWWIHGSKKLSSRAKIVIEKQSGEGMILISSISIWEIALLIKKERVSLTMDLSSWLEKIESLSFIQFVPIDTAIAVKSVFLPEKFHADPADRIIVATAREYGAILITNDEKIRKYPHVETLW